MGSGSSPRAWGCFFLSCPGHQYEAVFPTCVGVFPLPVLDHPEAVGLPHVRGGVSGKGLSLDTPIPSSPRAWGCFHTSDYGADVSGVFPTCVGVFLICWIKYNVYLKSSPRAWGCFRRLSRRRGADPVFPTCVGVFPTPEYDDLVRQRLPHVRGGVSFEEYVAAGYTPSSPRAWGCF